MLRTFWVRFASRSLNLLIVFFSFILQSLRQLLTSAADSFLQLFFEKGLWQAVGKILGDSNVTPIHFQNFDLLGRPFAAQN